MGLSIPVGFKFSPPYHILALRNDFSEKLHRFMSGLTDTRWKMEGKTVLYIPNEGRTMPVETAARDKDFVQRMEGEMCVIIFLLGIYTKSVKVCDLYQ